jgi:hypothetical protein
MVLFAGSFKGLSDDTEDAFQSEPRPGSKRSRMSRWHTARRAADEHVAPLWPQFYIYFASSAPSPSPRSRWGICRWYRGVWGGWGDQSVCAEQHASAHGGANLDSSPWLRSRSALVSSLTVVVRCACGVKAGYRLGYKSLRRIISGL